jgi:hypothetical protein
VLRNLTRYSGLELLSIELTPFDLAEVMEDYINVLKIHSTTLRHISLSKNKIPKSIMEEIKKEISPWNVIDRIDLLHIK